MGACAQRPASAASLVLRMLRHHHPYCLAICAYMQLSEDDGGASSMETQRLREQVVSLKVKTGMLQSELEVRAHAHACAHGT